MAPRGSPRSPHRDVLGDDTLTLKHTQRSNPAQQISGPVHLLLSPPPFPAHVPPPHRTAAREYGSCAQAPDRTASTGPDSSAVPTAPSPFPSLSTVLYQYTDCTSTLLLEAHSRSSFSRGITNIRSVQPAGIFEGHRNSSAPPLAALIVRRKYLSITNLSDNQLKALTDRHYALQVQGRASV